MSDDDTAFVLAADLPRWPCLYCGETTSTGPYVSDGLGFYEEPGSRGLIYPACCTRTACLRKWRPMQPVEYEAHIALGAPPVVDSGT